MKYAIAILFLPHIAFAQLSDGRTIYDVDARTVDSSTTRTSTTNDGLNVDNTRDLGEIGTMTETDNGQGSRQNGAQSSSDSSGVQMLGMAMSAMFASQCSSNNPMACVMAGLTMMDALSAGDNKGESDRFRTALNPNATPSGPTNADANGQFAEQQTALQEQLAGLGYSINADGSVGGPNGESYTGSDFFFARKFSSKGFQSRGCTGSD